eukprot:4793737-Amphidinium_carterae.1
MKHNDITPLPCSHCTWTLLLQGLALQFCAGLVVPSGHVCVCVCVCACAVIQASESSSETEEERVNSKMFHWRCLRCIIVGTHLEVGSSAASVPNVHFVTALPESTMQGHECLLAVPVFRPRVGMCAKQFCARYAIITTPSD